MISYFLTHPLLERKILGIVEDELTYSNVYGVKTYPSNELLRQSFNDDYFDLRVQKWFFPYSKFRKELEGIKGKMKT